MKLMFFFFFFFTHHTNKITKEDTVGHLNTLTHLALLPLTTVTLP